MERNLPSLPKTKIIATIGPATWDTPVLQSMIDSGMTIARVNASFADHEEIERVFNLVRQLSDRVALMIDTKGHKIRLSDFSPDVPVKSGEQFSLFTRRVDQGVYLEMERDVNLEKQIPPGTTVLIDDGMVEMRVKEVKEGELVCEVFQGGILRRKKTVLIPGVHIDFGGISEKDKSDILLAKRLGYDFVAASYIRGVEDIRVLRDLLGEYETGVIAKIEDIEGVEHFDDILKEADGIMIARGDLGLGIPVEKVPIYQKQFIKKCNELGKPVIVATQMLQSMTENMMPTRAEINDVANAIFDGTDAVMLSSETAMGKYPVEAVQTMARVAFEVEGSIKPVTRDPTSLAKPTTNAIAQAVMDSCETLPIDKILVATGSGTTAKTIARFWPTQSIFAFTKDELSKRKLALSRGIIPDVLDRAASSSRDTGVQSLVRSAKERGYVADSDLVIVVSGANIMGQGGTNMLEINRVDQIIS